MESDEDSVLQ